MVRGLPRRRGARRTNPHLDETRSQISSVQSRRSSSRRSRNRLIMRSCDSKARSGRLAGSENARSAASSPGRAFPGEAGEGIADEKDRGAVEPALLIDDVDEGGIARPYPAFLLELAPRRFRRAFARFDESPGQRPAPATRLAAPQDEEDAPRILRDDRGGGRDGILVDEAALVPAVETRSPSDSRCSRVFPQYGQ